MRLSELSRTTDTAIATLKFYLREGLVQPGRLISRTQADYDETHVQRVNFVRALAKHSGFTLASIKQAVRLIENPPATQAEVVALAQLSVDATEAGEPDAPVSDAGPVNEAENEAEKELQELLGSLGWHHESSSPALGEASRALAAARAAGLALSPETLRRYAEASRLIAEADLDAVPTGRPADIVQQIVLGTLLVEPLVLALRRVAQQAVVQHTGTH